MADPLSVAGLAAGVVSLGLQVVGGLSNYLDAVKGRTEELDSAKQQATNMKDLLLSIQDVLPQVKNSWPSSATSIERHVQCCNAEISALHALLSELTRPHSSNPGVLLKFAELKQKLTYPFNRNDLARLEERLVKVNGALQTALQITGLTISITTNSELRQVHDISIAEKDQIQQIQDASVTSRNEFLQVRDVSITTGNQVQQIHDISINIIDEVRQMQNKISSMLQSTTLRAQGTAACVSSTTYESRESILMGGVRVPIDSYTTYQQLLSSSAYEFVLQSIQAVVSLASRPSLLSTSIETMNKYDNVLSPRSNTYSDCICHTSRRTVHYQKDMGCLSFSYGTLYARRHLPSCPFSRIIREKRATKLTVEYGGLKRLLQKAFTLSFMDTRGPGGRSIGPIFSYYSTVDEAAAPAFRMVNITKRFYTMVFGQSNVGDIAKVLQKFVDGIQELYSRGKACPRDLSSCGNSILHEVAKLISTPCLPARDLVADRQFTDTVISAITKLITLGVPLETYDEDGYTACALCLNVGGPYFTEFAKLLVPLDYDGPLVRNTGANSRITRNTAAQVFPRDLSLARAAGCGPLSLATMAGDERLVEEILRRHPEALEETDDFGNTPLHFAVYHSPCLRLILGAGGMSLLEKLDDTPDRTPLHIACYLGYKEPAQLLLASGSRTLLQTLEYCHESCLTDFLIALKQRRNELKKLALDNLTRAEAESLGLHAHTVLDGNAYKVQQLLHGKGVVIPSHLRVHSNDNNHDWYHGLSAYHLQYYIHTRSVFDHLWDLGFRDIDYLHPTGNLPILSHSSPDTNQWLIEHGADYWTPFCERNGTMKIIGQVTPAHFLCAEIGYSIRWESMSPGVSARRWFLEKLLRLRASDSCNCPCSVSGCTPLKALLDALLLTLSQENAMQACIYFIQNAEISLQKEDLMTMVRRMTFDTLELTHTCCTFTLWPEKYKGGQYTPEEIDEINSEQSVLLNLFADLTEEFEQIALEEHDGAPLIISDPEEFWTRRWLPRIEEVLEDLNGDDLTQEERCAAEAIGVVWGPQPVQENQQRPEDQPRCGTCEWVMREMDKIMNE